MIGGPPSFETTVPQANSFCLLVSCIGSFNLWSTNYSQSLSLFEPAVLVNQ